MNNNTFQNSFMSLGFNGRKKIRAKVFLSEMDRVIPYTRLLNILKDKYNSGAKTGRKKYDLTLMLKIHFLQQFYELGDLAMEEAIYDRISFQEFLGIDTLSSIVPDETTILNFRHFLEKNELQDSMFEEILKLLSEEGLYFQRGTIVDASIIKASSHTKNKARERDPEMSSTKKNNNFYFGMKTHIGVDSDSGIVHSIEYTTAKKSDISQIKQLLHGKEKAVFGDKAYCTKAEKKKARKEGIFYGMTNKATKSKKLSTKQKKRNKQLSSVRSKVEHPFRLLKCQFHYVKAKYRGLKKNGAAITMKLGLGNLFLMRKKLLQT